MTQTRFNIKTIELQNDAKDIKFEYLAGNQLNEINTYIQYVSEKHPHKHCVYTLFGKWEQVADTTVKEGKIQLIELM